MPSAVDYIEPAPLPHGLDSRSLRRRALQIAAVLAIIGLVAVLAPGLGDVRQRLEGAQPGWLGVAIVLEVLSCLSYVLMFRPIFCARMSLRMSYELGMSELAVGSLVPASGAAGLAFGAWALRRGGMQVRDIARRPVAFFVLKSAVNYEGRLKFRKLPGQSRPPQVVGLRAQVRASLLRDHGQDVGMGAKTHGVLLSAWFRVNSPRHTCILRPRQRSHHSQDTRIRHAAGVSRSPGTTLRLAATGSVAAAGAPDSGL